MSSSELTSRNRYKWSVNEILSLQREYELYELSIQEIALLHKRSAFSILHKLEKEQIIVNFNDARGYDKINFWDDEYHNEDEQSHDKEYDKEDEQSDYQANSEDNVINLSLQLPASSDSDSDSDSYDHEIVSHTQNIDDIDVVYFEDELMKKVQSANNKKRYDNMTLFDIVYELIERIERLEDKIVSIETTNSNSFFTFIKNWFYAKRIC
jgi:hypothetical protein